MKGILITRTQDQPQTIEAPNGWTPAAIRAALNCRRFYEDRAQIDGKYYFIVANYDEEWSDPPAEAGHAVGYGKGLLYTYYEGPLYYNGLIVTGEAPTATTAAPLTDEDIAGIMAHIITGKAPGKPGKWPKLTGIISEL